MNIGGIISWRIYKNIYRQNKVLYFIIVIFAINYSIVSVSSVTMSCQTVQYNQSSK